MPYPPQTDADYSSNLSDLGYINKKLDDLEARVAALEVASTGSLPVGSNPAT